MYGVVHRGAFYYFLIDFRREVKQILYQEISKATGATVQLSNAPEPKYIFCCQRSPWLREDRGEVHSFNAYLGTMTSASVTCRDRGRRAFTDQSDMACIIGLRASHFLPLLAGSTKACKHACLRTTVNAMNGMTSIRGCGKDVYCRRFIAIYFPSNSDTFRSARFRWDRDVSKTWCTSRRTSGSAGWRLFHWNMHGGQSGVCCTPTMQALCVNQRNTLQR